MKAWHRRWHEKVLLSGLLGREESLVLLGLLQHQLMIGFPMRPVVAAAAAGVVGARTSGICTQSHQADRPQCWRRRRKPPITCLALDHVHLNRVETATSLAFIFWTAIEAEEPPGRLVHATLLVEAAEAAMAHLHRCLLLRRGTCGETTDRAAIDIALAVFVIRVLSTIASAVKAGTVLMTPMLATLALETGTAVGCSQAVWPMLH